MADPLTDIGVRLSDLARDLGPVVADTYGPPGVDPVIRFAEIADDSVTAVDPATVLLDTGGRCLQERDLTSRVGAAAVIAKYHPERPDPATPAASDAPCVVLVEPHASWFTVIGLVRERLGLGTFAGTAGAGNAAFGTDLFEVANAVSELVAGPVTIEDRDLTVLAFSQQDQTADAARAATVLGRAVPMKYRELLKKDRIQEKLATTEEPLYLDLGGDLRPRLAMPVTSGGQLLGSMWAVVDGPVAPVRAAAFADAARVVALALLRRRAEARGGHRLRAGLLTDVLTRTPDAAEARVRLGLGGRQVRIVAADLVRASEEERLRTADAVALQLAAISSATAATVIDDRLYALLPTDRAAVNVEAIARRILHSVAWDAGYIAIGRRAKTLDEITYSRRDTDRIIRVRRVVKGSDDIVFSDAVTLDAILLAAEDYLEAESIDPCASAVGRMLAYDEENGTELLRSVEAYFASMGDIGVAAGHLHVHPNTLRYRLKRAADVGGVDLSDPDAVLHVWLTIRTLRIRHAGG